MYKLNKRLLHIVSILKKVEYTFTFIYTINFYLDYIILKDTWNYFIQQIFAWQKLVSFAFFKINLN